MSGVSSVYGGSGEYARFIPSSEISPEPPSLSARLVEIDRRLREIQAQLAPDREAAPVFAPPAADGVDPELAEGGPDPAEGDPEPAEAVTEPPRRGREGPLASVLASVSRSRHADPSEPATAESSDPPEPATPESSDPIARQIEQLTELQASLLSSMTEVLAGFHRALAELEGHGREITISAGPFETLDALREFERRLSGLGGVDEVTVRGYEGDDRAVIDVRLDVPTT